MGLSRSNHNRSRAHDLFDYAPDYDEEKTEDCNLAKGSTGSLFRGNSREKLIILNDKSLQS